MELLEKEEKYRQYLSKLEEYEYITKYNEEDLFKFYLPAFQKENIAPFYNFNQNHRDIYMRLKFRILQTN